MKKRIYGIYDQKTGNVGDICTLDCDEEFVDGFTSILSNRAIPDYLVRDLVGLCYGELVTSDGCLPVIDPQLEPTIIAYGRDVVYARKEPDHE